MILANSANAICADPAEQIDVVRIRLTRPASATVMVSEFRTANRVLADWAAQSARFYRDCQVDYEITFYDGYRLRGCHALLRKGKSHVSLSRVVRRMFKSMAQGVGCGGAVPGLPSAELSRYHVDG